MFHKYWHMLATSLPSLATSLLLLAHTGAYCEKAGTLVQKGGANQPARSPPDSVFVVTSYAVQYEYIS